jgi:hypothetical protein
MSEYFSEWLNTGECLIHRKAKDGIKNNQNYVKVDPVQLEEIMISLDKSRIAERSYLKTISKYETELATLKEAGRWIPVGERLPEDGRWSMVIDCEYPTRIFIGVYEPEEREFYNHAGDSIGSPDRHITHWMPLPQPPEVKHE